MKSTTTAKFRKQFQHLPLDVRKQAKKAYSIWKENQHHPSLKFKKIHSVKPVYSIRIGISWRAIGLLKGDTITWFWIGSHEEYNKLITTL